MKFGTFIRQGSAARRSPPTLCQAEQLGFESAWIAEQPDHAGQAGPRPIRIRADGPLSPHRPRRAVFTIRCSRSAYVARN